jgi:hypothetical protein
MVVDSDGDARSVHQRGSTIRCLWRLGLGLRVGWGVGRKGPTTLKSQLGFRTSPPRGELNYWAGLRIFKKTLMDFVLYRVIRAVREL